MLCDFDYYLKDKYNLSKGTGLRNGCDNNKTDGDEKREIGCIKRVISYETKADFVRMIMIMLERHSITNGRITMLGGTTQLRCSVVMHRQ